MGTSVPSIAHIPATRVPGHVGWTSLIARLETMWQVYKERHALKSLDERMLNDLGINRGQADVEANRSFFDLPDNRI